MTIRRTTLAAAAIAAAGLVPALSAAASAHGHVHAQAAHGGGHGSDHAAAAQARVLGHAISNLDRRLAHLETSDLVTTLDDADEFVLDANIETDRAGLADLAASVSTLDAAGVQAARTQLRSFRVENYVLAATILHSAEDLAVDASTVPAAQDELTLAVDAALTLSASSTKADVAEARSHVDAAETAIADAAGTTTTDSGSTDNPPA